MPFFTFPARDIPQKAWFCMALVSFRKFRLKTPSKLPAFVLYSHEIAYGYLMRNYSGNLIFLFCSAIIVLISLESACATPDKIETARAAMPQMAVGPRIAYWAAYFVGTPYDRDPLGEYVTRKAIVADDRIDCMYLVFRSVELAMGNSSQKAEEAALDKRFHSKGILRDGIVINYDDRFQYGEDMIDSGKWGREMTAELGHSRSVPDSRRKKVVKYAPVPVISKGKSKLKEGDIIYFVKKPEKRIYGEVIGHMGIIKIEGGKVYLIHAGGTKKSGGEVRKVDLEQYIRKMPYLGAKVTRFE